jgi:aminodeoxyfutalosine synthase
MVVSEQELSRLASSHDIISLGMVADEVRRARHGARTTFVRVANVDAAPGAPISIPPASGEVRVVGAPSSIDQAVVRVRESIAAAGEIPVSAFMLTDLEQLAARDRATLRALLERLRAAGLELVAEAAVDQLQDAARAIEAVNIVGMAVARVTVHQLASADPLLQLQSVAALQRRVGVLRAFAPLPRRTNPAAPTTGYDDVRRVALARIVCENVPSIQVDWSLYGPKLAQVALTVGVDDVDAVSPLEESTEGRRRAPLEEVRRNIRAAGFEPSERNARFDVLYQ